MSERRLGIIMHGVTGRMGMNQHLIRSILEIRKHGAERYQIFNPCARRSDSAARSKDRMELYATGLIDRQQVAIDFLARCAQRRGTREVISWQSQDGTTIEGVLIKPADFDPAKKYPLLCIIHGGPTGIDRPVLLTPDARSRSSGP